MHSAGMPTTLEQANELIYKLLDRIAELEDRLNQHSGNSSKPPSSDGPGAPPPARKRPASGKQRGAQPGHKGHRRERHPLDARLTLVPHYPAADCACCGGDMVAHAKPYQVHQVFELPEVSYLVTEHQLYRATCSRCIGTTQAALPDNVSSSQMGANLLSYIALQSGQFHQSVSQIQQQLKQHFGLSFSRGAISEAQGRVSAMLTPTYQAIKQQVQTATHVHADETRHQRGGERRWMWLALSKIAVCFMVDNDGPLRIDSDPRRVQREAARIRCPTGGNQQLVSAQFTVSGGQHEFAVHMGDLAGLRVLQHLDALGTESGCHRLADGRVFTEEQGIARQGRDLAAQPGKGLRQLQRHHRRADYGKAFGNGVARQGLGGSPVG